MNKQSYDMGYALGIMKSGSVERVEKKNSKMLKLAKLLHKKGKLQKAALFGRLQWIPDGGASPDTKSPEYQKNLREEVGRRAAGLRETQGGGGWGYDPASSGHSPTGEVAGNLEDYSKTGKMPNLPKAKGQGKPSKGEGYDDKGVISLDMDPAKRKRIQQGGGTGGDAGAAGGAEGEAGFYGGPQFGDIKKYWMQLLGQTPSQMSAGQTAREAGYGRALRHKGNLDWLKSMLLGPQSGHYGTGM